MGHRLDRHTLRSRLACGRFDRLNGPAPLISFPEPGAWMLPHAGWHFDLPAWGPTARPVALRLLGLVEPVAPRVGARSVAARDDGAMHSDAETVEAYLEGLPEDRRPAIEAVRRVVRDHLPAGFEEVMQHGMISYVVPLARYPDTYNGQALAVASLASQKNHLSLYLLGSYGDAGEEDWLRRRWAETGKKLDMGKSCVRFRRLDDLPLDVIGEAIARTSVDDLIAAYERSRPR